MLLVNKPADAALMTYHWITELKLATRNI